MENLDYFFPDITTHQSREILLEEPIPFAFLIRQVKREYVVTFLVNNLEFRDEKLPTRTDSFLRQHHHELQSPQDIFQYIGSTSCKWLHPVSRANRAYGNINIPISDNCCDICVLPNPKRSHDDHHRLMYCVKCDLVIPKINRKSHKCSGEKIFKCDSSYHSSASQKLVSDHIKAIHQNTHVCDVVTNGPCFCLEANQRPGERFF